MAAQQTAGFSEQLRQYRQTAGLTQEELADRAGLSLRGLSDLERGVRRAPYPDTVRLLAGALQLDAEASAHLLRLARQARPSADVRHLRANLPTFLPVPVNSFVGRGQELEDVCRLLSATRLLTLIGTGGIGKTRLALEVASSIKGDYGDGSALVDLAALSEPRLVPQAVASAIDIREEPGRSMIATLVDALRRRRLLLILDNCEHLIDACAQLVHELLAACPGLRILATSRESLGIDGETVWRVPPLKVPEGSMALEQIAASEAVQLFVDRSHARSARFELTDANASLVAAICNRLEGIPLALELAAAYVTLLSPEQLLARLDDVLGLLSQGSRLAPQRQQKVRATIDWSYGLLTQQEKLLFDRLSVFAGGWTLEAAETVAGADGLVPEAVLSLLGRLVDKSLVTVEENRAQAPRYRLLETLRQYAGERLVERRSAETCHLRHAEFFLIFAEQMESELAGPRGMLAQLRLEQEHDNLRAATQWFVQQRATESAQRLAGALSRFWFFRGYVAEGEAWLTQALGIPADQSASVGRAKCLYGVAILALSRGDYARLDAAASDARAIWRSLGSTGQEAWCVFALGYAALLRGDSESAQLQLDLALELSQATEQRAAEANCLWALAELAAAQEDWQMARRRAELALLRALEVGWMIGIAVARRVLGRIGILQGDYSSAEALLETSLTDSRRLGLRWWTAETLGYLAQIAIHRSDLHKANELLNESMALAEDLGDRVGIAFGLEGYADLAVESRDLRRALALAGAAAALRELLGAPLQLAEQTRLERRLAVARGALGEPAAQEAWDEGTAYSSQKAINLARAVVFTDCA